MIRAVVAQSYPHRAAAQCLQASEQFSMQRQELERAELRGEIGVLDEVVTARHGSLFHARLLTSALRKATTSPLHRHIIAADFANCAQRGVGATVNLRPPRDSHEQGNN
jgi:hypothetical protein